MPIKNRTEQANIGEGASEKEPLLTTRIKDYFSHQNKINKEYTATAKKVINDLSIDKRRQDVARRTLSELAFSGYLETRVDLNGITYYCLSPHRRPDKASSSTSVIENIDMEEVRRSAIQYLKDNSGIPYSTWEMCIKVFNRRVGHSALSRMLDAMSLSGEISAEHSERDGKSRSLYWYGDKDASAEAKKKERTNRKATRQEVVKIISDALAWGTLGSNGSLVTVFSIARPEVSKLFAVVDPSVIDPIPGIEFVREGFTKKSSKKMVWKIRVSDPVEFKSFTSKYLTTQSKAKNKHA